MNDGTSLLHALRAASETKDRPAFRAAVDTIQRMIHGDSKTLISPMRDAEVLALVERTSAVECIPVGTGTKGQRVYVDFNRGELFMTEDTYGKEYRDRFRALFGVQPDGEARVRF